MPITFIVLLDSIMDANSVSSLQFSADHLKFHTQHEDDRDFYVRNSVERAL